MCHLNQLSTRRPLRRQRVQLSGFFSVTRTPHGEQVQIFCRRFPCTSYYVGVFTHVMCEHACMPARMPARMHARMAWRSRIKNTQYAFHVCYAITIDVCSHVGGARVWSAQTHTREQNATDVFRCMIYVLPYMQLSTRATRSVRHL